MSKTKDIPIDVPPVTGTRTVTYDADGKLYPADDDPFAQKVAMRVRDLLTAEEAEVLGDPGGDA